MDRVYLSNGNRKATRNKNKTLDEICSYIQKLKKQKRPVEYVHMRGYRDPAHSEGREFWMQVQANKGKARSVVEEFAELVDTGSNSRGDLPEEYEGGLKRFFEHEQSETIVIRINGGARKQERKIMLENN